MDEKLVEYIEAGLKKDGYDGLIGDECECRLNDLQNCGECLCCCEPAYFVKKNSKLCVNVRTKAWCRVYCEKGCLIPEDLYLQIKDEVK